jgi:hypothetical protein
VTLGGLALPGVDFFLRDYARFFIIAFSTVLEYRFFLVISNFIKGKPQQPPYPIPLGDDIAHSGYFCWWEGYAFVLSEGWPK